MIKTLINNYIDFRNDYLTIDRYAEHKGLTVDHAAKILDIGKHYYALYYIECGTLKLREWDFNTIKGAVRLGLRVHWKNKAYTLIYDYKAKEYYIHHDHSTVKLYEPDYNPIDFYITE